MNDYRQPVEDAIRATAFHSPTSYSWFGKRAAKLSPAVKRALDPTNARNYLLFKLQSQLYNDFYCPGFPEPRRPGAAGLPLASLTPFVEALSAANAGCGCWRDGWEVRAVKDGEVVVCRRNLEAWVRPEDCLVGKGGQISPGMRLSLRFPKELLGISPGFYMAQSDRQPIRDNGQTVVRFYWHLTAEGAIPFVRTATLMLNGAHLPFNLKVLNDPDQFTRCDAAVVYVLKDDYHAVSEILARIYREVDTSLRSRTPVFTKPLAPGVGLAEDPGQGESFGQHRCRLLADGMIRGYEQGEKSVEERLQVVADRFVEEGICLEQPYLNPGSSDDYHFEPGCRRQSPRSCGRVTAPGTAPRAEAFLQTAADIGQRLSQEAVWHGERCNWLGILPEEHDLRDGQSGLRYGALGPELYSGTSGVALFLAELHAAAGDPAARRTALGAIRQVLWSVGAQLPPNGLGLYTGRGGIAFAAARVGTVLGEEELLERAAEVLQGSARDNPDEHGFDLLSGSAGAIATLLALRDILEDASLLDIAMRLGDELLQTADRSEAGYSWRSTAFPNHRHLTGFSHGAAGVGYALLELFHATGDAKYRRGAEHAFQYERYWFDAEAGNWPDFRGERAQGKRCKRPMAFATSWCHGAPGIALSRLRAYEILKDPTCQAEAMTALQTTRQTVETVLHSGMGNYSLCHGLAGNAELLLHGYQVLGQEWADGYALAHEVANIGIETYAARGLSWPCGTGGSETPGLLLGLAGIGHFYLRLHDPTTPSILMVQREHWTSGRYS